MVRFSYEKLFLASRGDSNTLVKLFLDSKATGIDYILNGDIIKSTQYSNREKAEYLGLCSLRNHSNYMLLNTTYLLLDEIPSWIPDEVVKTNPLIEIKENKIIFPYERSTYDIS